MDVSGLVNNLGRYPREHRDDILTGGLALVVYMFTLAPSVTTGDSGELITAAARLELAHPTGYPLYILLGKLFVSVFFFLSPDLALNAFSAICAALAVVLVRRLLYVLAGDRYAAAGAALLFAFSGSLWSQATSARVYALNCVLVLLALIELARLYRENGGSLSRAWLFFGLAMADHTVSIVLLPLMFVATWVWGGSLSARLKAAAWCVPGLAIYLYIPLTASLEPYQNWGDPSTLSNLYHYLARTDYWSRSFVHGARDVWTVALHYVELLPGEFTWPGTALLAVALVVGVVRQPLITLVGLYLFASNMALMMAHGSRSDIFHWPRYMLTGWMGLFMVFSLGLAQVLKPIRNRAAAVGLALALPALALALNFAQGDRSGLNLARDFNMKILNMVEKGATVFAEGDNVLFPLIYLHHVEGIRPDVTLVLQGVNELSSMVIDPDNRPIYFTHHHNLGAPELKLVPDGLLYRLVRRDSDFTGRPWTKWSIPEFERIDGPGRLRYLDRNLVGDYLFMKAVNHEKDVTQTASILDRAMSIDFDNSKTFLNAGLLFERGLRFKEALKAFFSAREIDPRDELARGKVKLWRDVLAGVQGVSRPQHRASRLAAAMYDRGMGRLAVRVLEQASGAFKRSFRLKYNLAALYIATGDMASARDALEAALVLRPNDAAARRDLDHVLNILGSGLAWLRQNRDLYDGIPSRIEFAVPKAGKDRMDKLAEAAWREFRRVGSVVNAFDPRSEVGRINADTSKGQVTVSDDVAKLLRKSLALWAGTEHAFDPTVWPLKG
ncbi:MAG: DUF2723 domain-containing protein, partial [Deltaproteobacteria bacterium]|nr:DUF2723 domain-containing protein [Deltaproteobacteria bacterium]